MSNLYKKHSYLDKSVSYLCSQEIYEFDIKSAGFNIIKKYKLVSNDIIEKLEKMHKKKRQIAIGMLIRKNKDLGKALNEGFINVRKLFFEANNLKDEEVLSIKKDAIITLRYCEYTKFDNIEFVVKSNYTSYFYLNKMEFYYHPKYGIDVKGINKTLPLHKDYMVEFIRYYAYLLETGKRENVIKFLKEFINYYKRKELDIGYYRELNVQSLYKSTITIFDDTLYFNDYNDYENLDISYNYIHYIVPLLQILL